MQMKMAQTFLVTIACMPTRRLLMAKLLHACVSLGLFECHNLISIVQKRSYSVSAEKYVRTHAEQQRFAVKIFRMPSKGRAAQHEVHIDDVSSRLGRDVHACTGCSSKKVYTKTQEKHDCCLECATG